MNKKRMIIRFSLFLAVICLVLLFGQSVFAAYSFTSNGIIIARDDGSGFSYDYAPTVIVEDTTTKVWWCGHGSAGGDNIFYSSKVGAGSFSTPQVVMTPTQAWETTHTCDPSVIKGSWTVGGTTYTYAMYYGAAAEVAGGVTSTKIGVAFSNDGINWTKYASNPIISNLDSNYDYGVGMMTAYSTGGSNVTLAYFDQTKNEASIVRTSTDGIAFSDPYRLPFSGLDTIGDLAYSTTESKWYYTSKNQESKLVDGTDHADREVFVLRTNGSSLYNNDWSYVGVVSQSLTGYYMNHNPGWYRDVSGNMYESAGDRYLAFGAQTANSGIIDPNSWDLAKATLSGSPSAITAPGAFSISAPANSSANLDPYGVTFTWPPVLGWLS